METSAINVMMNLFQTSKVNMNTQDIFNRLLTYTPSGSVEDWEAPMLYRTIEGLLTKGWLPNEIISKLKWLEHIDPRIDEDRALRNMKLVDDQVEARLGKN